MLCQHLLHLLGQELPELQTPRTQDSGFSNSSISRRCAVPWHVRWGFFRGCPKVSSGKIQNCRKWWWEGTNRVFFLSPSARLFQRGVVHYSLPHPHEQATRCGFHGVIWSQFGKEPFRSYLLVLLPCHSFHFPSLSPPLHYTSQYDIIMKSVVLDFVFWRTLKLNILIHSSKRYSTN